MSDLTAKVARSLLSYDRDTGELRWRVRPVANIPAGTIAGRVNGSGYWQTNVRGRKYSNHRLAWLIVTGEWPKGQIDHVNRIRSDNRFCNLRDVSGSENCLNRDYRFTNPRGVSFVQRTEKWQVQVCLYRQVKYIGQYADRDVAISAYANAVASLRGEST
jgi:outer membrane protein assembly factor BamB